MHKCLLTLIFAGLFCGLASCKAGSATETSYTSHIANDNIEFSIPASWQNNSLDEDNPYELYFSNKADTVTTGVFVYYAYNFEENTSARDFFDNNITDKILAKLTALKPIAEPQTRELPDKTITEITFSGIYGVSKFYWVASLIEFKGNKDIFSITIQVSKPVMLKKYKPVLEKIVNSATLVNQ